MLAEDPGLFFMFMFNMGDNDLRLAYSIGKSLYGESSKSSCFLFNVTLFKFEFARFLKYAFSSVWLSLSLSF